MLRRVLCAVSDDRHCQNPDEQDTDFEGSGTSVVGPDSQQPESGDAMPPCVTNAAGDFGSTDSGDYEDTVVFQYQVQTTLDVNAFAFTSEVLPMLEKAYGDLVVPDLFQGSACEESRQRELLQVDTKSGVKLFGLRPKRHLQQDSAKLPIGTTSDLTGFESQPSDILAPGLDGVRCRTSLVEGAARCFVVNGGFTLHGSSDVSWAGPVALESIEKHMNKGELNRPAVHDDVVDVRFLSRGTPTLVDDDDLTAESYPPPNNNNSNNNSTNDDMNNNGGDETVNKSTATEAWPWVVLGCGILLFSVFLLLLRRRCRNNNNALDEASLDSDEKALNTSNNDINNNNSARQVPQDAYLQDNMLLGSTSRKNSAGKLNSPSSLLNLSATPQGGHDAYFFDDDDEEYEPQHQRKSQSQRSQSRTII